MDKTRSYFVKYSFRYHTTMNWNDTDAPIIITLNEIPKHVGDINDAIREKMSHHRRSTFDQILIQVDYIQPLN